MTDSTWVARVAGVLWTGLLAAAVPTGLHAGDKASAEPPASAAPKELTVEQILAETLTDEDYGETERCIDMGRINNTRILDRQHVAFRLSARRIYVVKLVSPCRSLDYDDVLSLNSTSGRLCRLDSIHTIDRASGIPGVPCQIDSFRQVSPEQYQFLRAELKKHRNR